MADNPKKQKQISDWINRPRSQKLDLSEQRQKLFEALNAFIRQQGGWVTSLPSAENLRFEIPRKSSLPSRLLELGYSVRAAGIGTRITGATEHHGFTPVDIIEITLGK